MLSYTIKKTILVTVKKELKMKYILFIEGFAPLPRPEDGSGLAVMKLSTCYRKREG